MNIIVLIREPYLDKIPSLKTLIWYLSDKYEMYIISSKEEKYPNPSFKNPNIKYVFVNKRSKNLELPTSLKLLLAFLKSYLKIRPKICIGGDTYSNLLIGFLNKILPFRHIYFLLEYPQIITEKNPLLTPIERHEVKSLKLADYIITHDKWHSGFLEQHFNIDPAKILLLPNSSATVYKGERTLYFHELFNLANSKNVILHSGGLGIWFRCKEVANEVVRWPENTVLVFHTSHDVTNDQYYKELIQNKYSERVLFSTKPVSTSELDIIISSAYIGLAIYSKGILGYRAELMGFAAGKIGNYLKCGIPVIATSLSSFEYIRQYQCGILVNDEKEIAEAIRIIENNYNNYSRNALKCYDELWEPSSFLETIMYKVESN